MYLCILLKTTADEKWKVNDLIKLNNKFIPHESGT